MELEKKPETKLDDDDSSSKWQELANLVSRENRDITIKKDLEKDPQLKKIHDQRNRIFSEKPPQ